MTAEPWSAACANPRCGAVFAVPLLAAVQDGVAVGGRRVVFVCGACRTPHYRGPAGLRALTPAERFRLELACEPTLRAAERAPVPAGGMAGFAAPAEAG